MFVKQFLALVIVGALPLSSTAVVFADESAAGQQAPGPSARQTPEQLQQLVAPVALYPDELVAEVFAAATYPYQVAEADRWLQDHQNLQRTTALQCNRQAALGLQHKSIDRVSLSTGEHG